MRKNDAVVRQTIEEVLSSQYLAVLASERRGQPYSSLMAFAHTPDLQTIVVATGQATRKHVNLLGESRVSLLIDNRTNSTTDFHAASAITVIGRAEQVSEEDQEHYQNLYLDKHPYLKSFLQAPTTSIFKIAVRHYLMVNRFQNVLEYHITDETDIFAE